MATKVLLLALAALCLASSCNRPNEWSVQSGVAEAVRPIQLQRNGMRVEDVSNLATAADVPGVVLVVAKSCPWYIGCVSLYRCWLSVYSLYAFLWICVFQVQADGVLVHEGCRQG